MTTVHAGSLGRWFEHLCRLQVVRLADAVQDHGEALKPGRLPTTGGVYCFWWTGDTTLLCSSDCCRSLTLAGPNQRPVHVEFDDDWLGIEAGGPIPLYVGKTADSVASRVGQHLMLKSPRAIPMFTGHAKQPRPTTSCQLRAGIDQLFPQIADTRALVLSNIGISFVSLGGDHHAANRFYLEDLAVGMMRPILNIDVER
jgi:hypothetical protein